MKPLAKTRDVTQPVRRRTRLGVWALMLCLLPLGCSQHESAASQTADTAKEPGIQNSGARFEGLPRYELQIAAAELDALESNPYSNDTHPATFKAGGKVYTGVKVRVRGSWSRSWPKKSLKIEFDHDTPFEG